MKACQEGSGSPQFNSINRVSKSRTKDFLELCSVSRRKGSKKIFNSGSCFELYRKCKGQGVEMPKLYNFGSRK